MKKWLLTILGMLGVVSIAGFCWFGAVQRAAQERRIERLEKNELVFSNVVQGLIEVAQGQEANHLEMATNIARVLAREIVERREGERR